MYKTKHNYEYDMLMKTQAQLLPVLSLLELWPS